MNFYTFQSSILILIIYLVDNSERINIHFVFFLNSVSDLKMIQFNISLIKNNCMLNIISLFTQNNTCIAVLQW